jgi:hypothetical protein
LPPSFGPPEFFRRRTSTSALNSLRFDLGFEEEAFMNLFDILKQAQGGGQGIDALARQFGLSPQQTQSAVEALLPAFSKGFQQTASTPQGLGSLLTMLAGGQSLQGADAGNGILGQLFGSKDLSRAVAAQASQASGVGQDVLKKMLPALATMLMGGLAKQTNQQMAAGTFGASNPLGEIIEQMMRQGQGGQAAPQGGNNPIGDILGQILKGGGQQAPQGGNNPLGDILGQILKGGGQQSPQQAPQGNNPLGDILDQVLKGGRQQPRAPQGAPNNPIGDILEQILGQRGGGQAGRAPEPEEEPEAPAPRQRRQPRQQQQPANPLEDILGKMFRPGGDASQSEQYQQGIDNIFEQFRRGVDRHRP